MPYQPHRGNPEAKQYFVVNNLIGGMNTLSADDVVSTVEAREVLNMHLSGSGALVKRKGFKYAEILNTWLSQPTISPTYLPDGDIYFIKVIKDEGNITKYLEEFDNWEDFRNFIRTRAYSFVLLIGYATGIADELGNRTIKVDLIKFINDEDTTIVSGGSFETTSFGAVINESPDGDDFTDFAPVILDGGDFTDDSGIQQIVQFNGVYPAEANLTNIDIVSFLGKHYLLLDQLSRDLSGILEIDEFEINNFTHRIISNQNLNNIYKPSPIDIDTNNTLGGYNMLYTSPKDYVKNHTSIRAIHGIYITDSANNQVFEDFSIPTDGEFRLNIIFSGASVNLNSFQFEFFTEDTFGNRTSIPYVSGFDPYTHNSTFIDDAIASYRIELDFTDFDNINTITVDVKLVKEETAIIPVKQFSSESALQNYFVDKDYYLVSTDPIGYASQEQVVENAYHLLRERNGTTYNFIERELVVYRENEPTLFNFNRTNLPTTDLYVLKDDNKVYKMVSRSKVSSNETAYDNAEYVYNKTLIQATAESSPYTTTVNNWFDDNDILYKLRADVIIKIEIYDANTGQTLIETQYFSIDDSSDVEIGTIFVNNFYVQESAIIAAGVVQVANISNAIPKLTVEGDNDSGEIYSINDKLDTTDTTQYYKYNNSNTATFTDFDFYIAEIDTTINQVIEYPVVDSDPAPVLGINFDNARILEIEGRLVAYKGNTIWFSDFRRFNYFPSNTYFNLSLTTDDEITSINYFRGSYIIFTRKMIWKMRGNLDQGNITFEILNDSIGCIAPKSVKPFNNTLVFMSRDGLYKIKQNFYLDGLENVDKIDKRILNVLPEYSTNYEAMLYDEQYVLFTRDSEDYDALRYYYNVNLGTSGSPFVVDKYAQQPEHMFDMIGTLYAIKDRRFWIYDEGYTDFLPTYTAYTEEDEQNSIYRTRLKLPAFSFGYPTHDKKFKNIFIKTTTGETMPLFLTIKIDGYDYASPYNFNVFRDGDGIINYEVQLETESASLGSFVVGEHRLGQSDVNQHKVVVGGKGKNIMLIVEQESSNYFGITNVGYLFKLGKVRGDV
jgi:hypothetical protein